MVVNDTEEILDTFKLLLEGEGYEVILYSYAPKEMEEVIRAQPDLVILDLMFGGEKLGWNLLEKMKLIRETASIPVILCTAATREVRDIEGHLKAQGVSLVAKPFDIDTLLNTITTLLEQRKNISDLRAPDERKRKSQ